MTIFEQRESAIRAYCNVYPVVFKTASNARQTDEQGNQYIDFFAGAGVLNFGHNNARMKQAMIEYLQQDGVTHSLDMHTTAKAKFMQHFTDTILEPRNMPHKMQFIGPTGTNAVEAALKLARRVTGRQNVIAFHHAFHGMTLGSLACTANQYFRGAAGVPLNHVTHHAFGCEPHCDGCELGCGDASLQRLRQQFEDSSSGVLPPAAFLVETIQAEGGVNVANKQWLQGIQQLAHDFGALFIVDDIQVGMGRTGSFFSFDDLDIDPDIVCLAKGIGGMGTPMAMNLIKPDHDQHWSPGEHTGTFRGQGLSFVAGDVALDYFDDDKLMQDVAKKTETIMQTLQPLAQQSTIQVRGKGMIVGVDLGDGDKVKNVVNQCFNKGLLVAACGTGGRVIKVIPPLTIPDDDLDQGLNILYDSINEVMQS